MRPEARTAARSAALTDAKEKKKLADAAKKEEKAKRATTASKGQTQRIVGKQGAKGAPQKIKATTR
jgi:large subunit ribosomal protein L24e